MKRVLIGIALLALVHAASAAPLGDADKTALAGEWRAHRAAAGDACTNIQKDDPRLVLEFAMTGGQLLIDDPGDRRLMIGVQFVDANGDALSLAFSTATPWIFTRAGKDVLVSEAPPAEFAALKGLRFRRCRPPADRSALKIDRDAVDFFSVMMPPDYPTFIDAHEKAGCKAASYKYLSIDLVGPENFAVTTGTLQPGKGATPPKLDNEQTWAIDAAEELPNVVRLTITPLTGPSHARGAPTKISLIPGTDTDLLTIPEWDAVYRRCTIRELGN